MSSNKRRKIAVIGDWLVDDTWLIGNHHTKIANSTGLAHYRSLHHPDNVVRKISGAGTVASQLYDARLGVEGYEYGLICLGLWHPDDQEYMTLSFKPQYADRSDTLSTINRQY